MGVDIKKELEAIEYKKRTWKSKFARRHSVWEEIAERINGTKGKEQKKWIAVMDLFHLKYKQ